MNRFKNSAFIVILAGLFLFSIAAAYAGSADDLREKARGFYDRGYYTAAYENYKKASDLYSRKGDIENARACNRMIHLIQRLCADYQLDEKSLRELIQKKIPLLSESELNELIKDGKIPFKIIDGKSYYFTDAAANILFANMDLMKKTRGSSSVLSFIDSYGDIVFSRSGSGYPVEKWKPDVSPVKYYVEHKISIPRDKLPKTGDIRVWFPLPVLTACQRDVEVVSVSPEEYFRLPAVIDGDIGLIYCSVPVDKIKEKLELEVKFCFTHYRQSFDIDPATVGEYDKESDLYKRYTRSSGNTIYNEEIKNKALEIAGEEKNPYKAAHRIYDYVVRNIKYGFMPHISLNAEGSPESVYVHEHGYGDCGAQSAYFSALCRSLGIPARTTGGIQLCPEHESPHFWAEFYLENYGWVPADTSIAQEAFYLTGDERNRFIDYFFANQDPYRFVIQKDIDVPLVPLPGEPPMLPMAIQSPVIESPDAVDNPSMLLTPYMDMKIYPVSR